MQNSSIAAPRRWLRNYYVTRAAFSLGWIALLLTLPAITALLLVAYPAWDALANLADARTNGGLRANLSQALNLAVSALTTLAVAVALGLGMNAVFVVFGAWASLSGLLQFATAARRWSSAGAQWAMILSGLQSALAGGFLIKMGLAATPPDLTGLAGYAGFGAFYFLVSALWLTATRRAAVAG